MDILLAKSESPSANDCSKQIYGKRKDNRIEKLKSRLKSRILDSLLLDVNLDRSEVLGPSDRMGIKIKKKLAQYHVLNHSQPRSKVSVQLLNEIISLSKTYEYYPGVQEGLKFKKYDEAIRKGPVAFKRINKEIDKYAEKDRWAKEAIDSYFGYLMLVNERANPSKIKQESYLKKHIKELKKGARISGSANVLHFLYVLEFELCQLESQYKKAKTICQQHINHLKSNKAVCRDNRLGAVYDYLSECEVNLGDFDKALEAAKRGECYFIKDTINYYICLEHQFYALVYMGDYAGARAVTELLQSGKKVVQGQFRKAKYTYFRACTFFLQERHDEVHQILLNSLEIFSDKAGWNISIRLLCIMSFVEEGLKKNDHGSLDAATAGIAALVKHTARLDKSGQLERRDKLITQTLQSLVKHSFSFQDVVNTAPGRLQRISLDVGPEAYQRLSSEIIPFHNWFMEKAQWPKPQAKAS